MEKKSRTYNSIVNSLFGVIAALISVALNFVVRIFLVKFLGDEINGLHNLFQNTINVMALIEAGIASAMVIHLYKPVQEKDEAKIKGLLLFYRKIYFIVSFVFIAIGLIVSFFVIDKIVTTTIDIAKVRIYFLLFSGSFFVNYFTYYKRSVLYADQKNRISILCTTISEIVFRGAAIFVAFLTKDYLFFLFCIIAEKLFGNLLVIIYVNKKYPYLRHLRGSSLSSEDKKAVFKTVRPLMVNQTASTIQKSASSILISILLGSVSIVGYFGNYQLVRSTVELLFSQVGGAFTSSFGNLSTTGDKERMYYIYNKMRFFTLFLCCIIVSGFLVCIQEFIELFFSKTYVLNFSTVVILAVALIVYLLSIPAISVQNALGLHRKDVMLMIIQALASAGLGYLLGYFWGMEGILIGVNAPLIVFTLVIKGLIINKEAFDKKPILYFLTILRETAICFLICSCSVLACYFLNTGHLILNILVKGIIAIAVSTLLMSLFSIKNEFFISFLRTMRVKIVNVLSKTKD